MGCDSYANCLVDRHGADCGCFNWTNCHDVGIFTPEVILYVSLAAIGTFTTPSYELSVANKIVRLIILALVAIFKLNGLIIGFTLLLIYLTSIRSLQTPYMWPFLLLMGRLCGKCSFGRLFLAQK